LIRLQIDLRAKIQNNPILSKIYNDYPQPADRFLL